MKLAENFYYVGVNDRSKDLFENMLPLPYGVSYNSFLLVDDKVALIDTVEAPFVEQQLETIQRILNGRLVDYLIVNHMEPDHSSGIQALRLLYPQVQIVGNAKTLAMLQGYYGISDGVYEVKEGSELALGKRTLRFYMTPMVHWPEVMMAYDIENHILFSADAFGCFGTLDAGILDTQLNLDLYWKEMYRYYANIVGKYGNPVQTALKKLLPLQIDMICSTHGPVWTKHLNEAVSIYDRMSRYEGEKGVVIVYGSMYGHTERMAQVVARGAGEVCKKVFLYDISKTDSSFIVGEIFRYKGLILGSPTYSNDLFPPMKALVDKLELRGLKNRQFGAFGSYTWAGAAVRSFLAFAERMKWETPPTVEVKQAMTPEQEEDLMQLGRTIATQL